MWAADIDVRSRYRSYPKKEPFLTAFLFHDVDGFLSGYILCSIFRQLFGGKR